MNDPCFSVPVKQWCVIQPGKSANCSRAEATPPFWFKFPLCRGYKTKFNPHLSENEQGEECCILCVALFLPFTGTCAAFITQIAALQWDCDVKLHCKNDTHVACLAETQLPRAFLVSEPAEERETCWHVAKLLIFFRRVKCRIKKKTFSCAQSQNVLTLNKKIKIEICAPGSYNIS